MNTDISDLITNILHKQDSLGKAIKDYKSRFDDCSNLSEFFSTLKDEYLYSTEIINLIADSLQFLEFEKELAQFNLADILTLYKITTIRENSNINFFTDYILFKINVLGDAKGALPELKEFIEILKNKKDNLENILNSIVDE